MERQNRKRAGLSSFLDRHLPSKQEKVAPAKSTPEGQTEPEERLLDAVSDPYTSKVDRSAMWTTFREHGLLYPFNRHSSSLNPAREGGDPEILNPTRKGGDPFGPRVRRPALTGVA